MLVQRSSSGDAVAWLRSAGAKSDAAWAAEPGDQPTRSAPTGSPPRLILGDITIAAHALPPGADRTSGVAAGRMRLLLVRGGPVRIPSRSGPVEIGDAQGVLVTGTASVRISTSHESDVIAVGMPVDAFPELSLPRNSAILLEDAVLLGPIAAFVHTLHSGGPLDLLSRERFAPILRDMILVAIRRGVGGARVASVHSLHLRALAILQRRYTEAALTPSAVATEMSVSLRHLEREFQPSGRTIRQEIRRIRVAAAVALLQESASMAQTVDAIAARVGFSNGSSLARAISAEGLASPSRLRPGGRRGGVADGLHT